MPAHQATGVGFKVPVWGSAYHLAWSRHAVVAPTNVGIVTDSQPRVFR